MSWDAAFIDALASSNVPATWIVQTRQIGDETTYGGVYVMSTDARYGDPVLAGPPTMEGSRLSTERWTATVGGMTFDVSGDLATFRKKITRGTHVEVYLYAGDYGGRVSIGRVTKLAYARGKLTLSISDALAILDGRSVAHGKRSSLFYDLFTDDVAETNLTADYTPGDATVNVTSTAGFSRETGGSGIIRLGEFVLTYTGSTGNTFTGCSATGAYDTTATVVASGATVTAAALVAGHPLEMALKILMSTGAGTNGDYDTLPKPWAFGLPYDLVDDEDVLWEINQVVHIDAGAYTAALVVTDAQTSPKSWLLGWLSAYGIFPVMHQGSLTLRAGTLDTDRQREVTGHIGDEDIDGSVGVSSDWWDSNKQREMGLTSVISASVTIPDSAENLQTLPGGYDDPIDLSETLYDYAYEGDVMTEAHDRLYRFTRRVAEVLTIPVAGLWAMRLSVGDRVVFTSTLPTLRYDYSEGEEVLIVQVVPDPRAPRVTIRAMHHPADGEVFP